MADPPIVDPVPVPPEIEVVAQKVATRQNTINLLWEFTQAFLAVSLTLAAIYASIRTEGTVPSTLENALFVVLGFYFGRTNHSRPTPLADETKEEEK